MNTLLTTILIGIGLSMDAFSLSFSYGTLNINKKNRVILASLVGLFHFFMPILGLFIGNIILKYIIIDLDILLAIIISLIGIEMIISSIKKEDNTMLLSLLSFILFAFSVSIDSFSVGIGLKGINNNYLQVSIIFSLCSFIFTYVGLILGTKLNDLVGRYAKTIGGILLIGLGVYYFL
jgi:putative Mn2+ efflux pump MntP